MPPTHSRPSTQSLVATSTWRAAAGQERPVQLSLSRLAKEQALDQAVNEYHRLRLRQGTVSISAFCERYPDYRHSLRRLLDVQDNFDRQPHLELEVEHWPAVGECFQGYEILHELGVGAIARVYLAAELNLGDRLVALKISRRGEDEAGILGRLTHPNVVPIFSVANDPERDLTAVCMPYHGSATLADLLELAFRSARRPTSAKVILDAARERELVEDLLTAAAEQTDPMLRRGSYVDGVAWLGIQMADALVYTHQRGVLHRDLKPSNVLLTPSGRPMLLDFNLAYEQKSGGPRIGGTLPYMPPEQIREVLLHPGLSYPDADVRSDVFSLGVILYELFTGRHPFGQPLEADSIRDVAEDYLRRQRQPVVRADTLNPQVNRSLANLLERCLAEEPTRRPKSAEQLAHELRRHFGWRYQLQRFRLAALTSLLAILLVATSILHVSNRRVPAQVQHLELAVAALESRRYDEAVHHFNRVQEAEGLATVPVLLGRGYCYEQRGAKLSAQSELKRAADLSKEPFILDYYGYVAARQGRFASALAAYEEAAKRGSPQAQRYLSIAYCRQRSGIGRDSYTLSLLDKAIELIPGLSRARRMRALLAAGLPDNMRKDYPWEQAIRDLEIALQADPINPTMQADAARIYARAATVDEQWIDESIACFRTALQAGYSRAALAQSVEFDPWRTHQQFATVLAAPTQDEPIRIFTESTGSYLVPPTHDEIVARVRPNSAR